jgi:hypothetical protein
LPRFFRYIFRIYTPLSIFHVGLFLAGIDAFSPILPVICFIAGWWPVFQAALALMPLIRFSASARFRITIKPVPPWRKTRGARDALCGPAVDGKDTLSGRAKTHDIINIDSANQAGSARHCAVPATTVNAGDRSAETRPTQQVGTRFAALG